jgi:hypothetical protein
MGDTRDLAERINLVAMQPRTDVSSTGFTLADPGKEYLILKPSETADSFAVELAPGRYSAEWHSLPTRETAPGETLTVREHTKIDMSAPSGITGPAVVHVRRISS